MASTTVIANHPTHGYAVAEKAGSYYDPKRHMNVVRVDEDDKLLGGVVYQNYTGTSCALHMAGLTKGWANREMIIAAFHFPFVRLGCSKIFAQIPDWNRAALDYDLRLGFKVETHVAGVYKEGGVFLISMLRDECRWVSPDERG